MKTSNMDYEKKYKEALEKIRSLHRDYNQISTLIDVKEELENIFPELAESEDERIKEKVIATIHLYYGEPLEDEAKEMIAWLKKQGDANKEYWRGYREGKQEILDKYAELEKQGEQKSAAWSEEDANALNRISAILVDASEVKNWWKESRLIEREEMVRLTDFLKSLKDRYTWKPSDEQLDSLYDVLNPCDGFNREVLESLYVQLKKLKE